MNEKFLMNELKECHQKFDAFRLEIIRSATQKKFKETDASAVILIEAFKKRFVAHLQKNI
jgi:hypothetical protein